jgi:acetylornithine/N-succinyldiaminopimelate aminotransferase
VIETVTRPGFLTRVTEAGEYLTSRLLKVSHRHGCGQVRGEGLLRALDLRREIAPAVADLARGRGLLLNAPRPDSLRFMPALTVSDQEIDQMIDILDGVLRELD